ncbi:hypothetical protein B0H66DRAFT_540905 [Apodospora peruviana]|uniref:Pre-mRNA-processing factor 39 n=1 Tax=Apodospora peruviana TaxID=516989 RepID=A0AAE0IQX5_9PEZI|nr:hypothetical protein B0H66DRAFT_540905 [Apodospora peruviana]
MNELIKAPFGGSPDEDAEIQRLINELSVDADNYQNWEALVLACEQLDGGLNRNSHPLALDTLRKSYDAFLLKYPLFFGYWKKYADLEFNISGPESAEIVYERGCASITNSVDLWTEYCSFKMETTHTPQLVRDLFERAAGFVGLDFLAHPFWDKYIEYEERQEAQDKVFAILRRVIEIPMHQYSRYFERFRAMAHSRPLTELASSEELQIYRAAVDAEAIQFGVTKNDLEIERDIRVAIDANFMQFFNRTQAETTKRWTYEAEIKRPYFHVTELDHAQLANWRKYLDFEENEGDYARIVVLYERCLVTCAFYEEFWFRYARWMFAQDGKEEEVRNIYLKAATLFVPISKPGIRLQFAYFEEMQGRVLTAKAIHEEVLEVLPDAVEVIISLANLQRRQIGLDAAIEILKEKINDPTVDIFTKAALVTEWAFLVWKVNGSVDEARKVFINNVEWYADSRHFWQKYLEFELEQPTDAAKEEEHGARIRALFQEMRSKSRLPVIVKQELGQYYLGYLQNRGGKTAMKDFLAVDRDLFGPHSVSIAAKTHQYAKENSGGLTDLDDDSRIKAESRFYSFYQLYTAPDPNAQGAASFH